MNKIICVAIQRETKLWDVYELNTQKLIAEKKTSAWMDSNVVQESIREHYGEASYEVHQFWNHY